MYICVCVCVCVYIYIYREEEVYVGLYVYVCVYVCLIVCIVMLHKYTYYGKYEVVRWLRSSTSKSVQL